MGRRQGKGDYRGAGTVIRSGGYGFTQLPADLGQPTADEVVTPAMDDARKKSEELHRKLKARRLRRRETKKWLNAP